VKHPVWKKTLFICSALLIFIVTVEVFSYFMGKALYGGTKNLQTRRDRVSEQVATDDGMAANPLFRDIVSHPYLGFTFDSTSPEGSRLGFIDMDVLRHNAAKDINVLVIGGSVASLFYRDAKDYFSERLGAYFPGRNVRVFSGSCSGYKEPQQMLVFFYLLFLGAKIDLVINIDGYNEVALAPVENIGVPPDYPRSWKGLADTSGSPTTRRLVGKIALARDVRGWLLAGYQALGGAANTVDVLWFLLDKCVDRRIAAYQAALEEALAGNDAPPVVYDAETMARLADYWVRGSLMMSRAARDNGVVYVHVLQPNQYLKDSKPLSEEEVRHAYDESFPYVRWAREGYRLLEDRIPLLRKQGVSFLDATGVFRDVRETVYWDVCCHFNERGNVILAAAILDYIGTLDPVRRYGQISAEAGDAVGN